MKTEETDLNLPSSDLARVKLDLLEAIDARVQTQFERDREFIKSTMGVAAKVLGGVITFATILLAIFGVRTLGDIRKAIEDAAVKEVNRRLDKERPEVAVARKIETLTQRALVDSYLLQIERSKNERFQSVELSDVDLERVIEIVEDRETSLPLLRDALEVLRVAVPRERRSETQNLLLGLASASGENDWLKQDAERRTMLLSSLGNSFYTKPVGFVRDLINDSASSPELRIAAIRYTVAARDLEATSALENAAGARDPNISQSALVSLAKVQPANKAVGVWVQKGIASTPSLEDAAELINVADALVEGGPRSFLDSDRDEGVRVRLAKKLLIFVVNHNFAFTSIGLDSGEKQTLSIFSLSEPSISVGVPHGILLGRGQKVIDDIARDLAKAKSHGDLMKFIDAVSIGDRDRMRGTAVFRAYLSRDASILLVGGQRIGVQDAVDGLALAVSSDKKDLVARWWDSSGSKRVATISALTAVDQMQFALVTDEEFEEED